MTIEQAGAWTLIITCIATNIVIIIKAWKNGSQAADTHEEVLRQGQVVNAIAQNTPAKFVDYPVSAAVAELVTEPPKGTP